MEISNSQNLVDVVGIWGRRGWITAVSAWMCVPVVRLVKHVLTIYLTPRPEHLYLNSHAQGFHVRGCGTRNRDSDLDSQRGLQDIESLSASRLSGMEGGNLARLMGQILLGAAWRHISGNLVSGVLPGTPHPRAFVPVRGTFQGRSGNVFLSLLRPNWFTCIAHDYWNPERADQHGAITTLEE